MRSAWNARCTRPVESIPSAGDQPASETSSTCSLTNFLSARTAWNGRKPSDWYARCGTPAGSRTSAERPGGIFATAFFFTFASPGAGARPRANASPSSRSRQRSTDRRNSKAPATSLALSEDAAGRSRRDRPFQRNAARSSGSSHRITVSRAPARDLGVCREREHASRNCFDQLATRPAQDRRDETSARLGTLVLAQLGAEVDQVETRAPRRRKHLAFFLGDVVADVLGEHLDQGVVILVGGRAAFDLADQVLRRGMLDLRLVHDLAVRDGPLHGGIEDLLF